MTLASICDAVITTDASGKVTFLNLIAARATAFIYAVSRTGVTGARSEMSAEPEKLVARVRRVTDLPIAVGFGISTRAQVLEVWRYADAAVVGSAVVAEIEKLATAPDLVKQIGGFVQALLPQNNSWRAHNPAA